MSTAKHSLQQPNDGIHLPYAWTFADEATRIAGTVTAGTTPIVVGDVGKFGRQLDDDSIYMLLGIGPPLSWVPAIASSVTNLVQFKVIKSTAGSIAIGETVYAVGWDAINSAVKVEKAKSDSASTVPACGIANQAITDTAPGYITASGVVTGINLTAFSIGDPLFVSAATAGALTNARPQGTALVQKVAIVLDNAASGRLSVVGAGRVNALPNLAEGKTWVGDTNGVPQQVTAGSFPTYIINAKDFTNPLSADWAINALAPLAQDTNDSAKQVRLFDASVEEGGGFERLIPSGVTSMKIKTVARGEVAPGATKTAKTGVYFRESPDNVTTPAWSARKACADVSIPTNEFWQHDEKDDTLVNWGVTAGKIYEFEYVRDATNGSDDYADDLAVEVMIVSFS